MRRPLRAPGTLVGALRDQAELRGHKVAFRYGDHTLTFAELARAARRAADAIAHAGLRPGQVVAVGCRDPLERIVAHCGALLAGACALPLSPDYRDELAPMLVAAEARALVADADLVARAQAALADTGFPPLRCWVSDGGRDGVPDQAADWHAARDDAPAAEEGVVLPDDPALLCFTSGTTGRPKGVLHTHRRCVHNLLALANAWDWTAADVLYLPVVLHHVHGLQNGVHGTLLTGCTTILPEARPTGAAMLHTMAQERCTLLFAVPTHYERLLAARAEATDDAGTVGHSWRLCVSGSAPLLPQTHRRFREQFGQAICERYGMTETLMIASSPWDGERRAGTVGFPLPGTAVRVADPETHATVMPGDPGEVWVRGPSVFDGYHARPGFLHPATEAAFVDGWFRTGDWGTWDTDGRLRLLGRRDDLILSGGLNVHPTEVEDALCSHPGVAAAGVVGVPDADLGQAVAAAVVAHPAGNLDPSTLVAHVARRLAGYKKPRRLRIVEALPLNGVGKLDRAALATQLADAPLVEATPADS